MLGGNKITAKTIVVLIAIALLFIFLLPRRFNTLAFIRQLTVINEQVYIYYDEVNWLSGEEGVNFSIKKGFCDDENKENCLPNGYIIENEEESVVRIPLDKDAIIVMNTYRTGEPDDVETPLSFEEFGVLINNKGLYWNKLPYDITLSKSFIGGPKVIKIEERYVP